MTDRPSTTHRIGFSAGSVMEAFGIAYAWLAKRDGAVAVISVALHHFTEGLPYELTLYFEPEGPEALL